MMNKIKTHHFIIFLILILTMTIAQAAEITLRLHQMSPSGATIPSRVLSKWASKVEQESGGKIKIEMYPSMQLGGVPADLIDQVKDGTVDLTWTLFGYTPGRFPKTEVFELPFMTTNATASSMAFQVFYQSQMSNDEGLKGIHVLAVHTHGPGLLHTRDKPINKLEDVYGLKMRGTSRVINAMLMSLGAHPVAMPVIAVTEALPKATIDGTVLPFEIVAQLNIAKLAPYHTEYYGKYGLYTGTFVFAMNEKSYQKLPNDLKQVIDNNSGINLAKQFGEAMDYGDAQGRLLSAQAGNTTIKLNEEETNRWHLVSDQVTQEWFNDMESKGINGRKLYTIAKKLIESYSLTY